jgi:hypothetical protein
MIARRNEAEPLIAYVYGDEPPDVATIAAMGFEVVCFDSRAPWFNRQMLAAASAVGMFAVAHPMGPVRQNERVATRVERRSAA